VLILLVGIGGNSRGLFMTGITALFIAYFIGLLLGKFNHRIINFKSASFVLIGLWILTGPLADVGTAMLVVRDQRTDLTSKELISRTIDAYQNKSALEAYRLTAKEDVVVQDWDEHYFNNIFLARFCNLKFNDEGLKQSKKIGGVDKEMQDYSIERFLAIMPSPLLSLLNIKIDKETVISASFGDFLFSRAGGENALGGFRTGQFASTGMTAFGWWYLLLLGVGMIPVFFLVDLFVMQKQVAGHSGYRTYLSLGGLIPITHFFMFLSMSSTSESVVNIYSYLFRGWIELIILYGLVYFISRKLSSLLKLLNVA
jgi:heme/copper-type cytochrome/quinol oxidase subunit 4